MKLWYQSMTRQDQWGTYPQILRGILDQVKDEGTEIHVAGITEVLFASFGEGEESTFLGAQQGGDAEAGVAVLFRAEDLDRLGDFGLCGGRNGFCVFRRDAAKGEEK